MANNGDLNGVGWPICILNAGNNTGRRKEQNYDDENRNDGPREFQLRASIDLSGLLPMGGASLSELYCGVDQQGENYDEYRAGNFEHKKRKIKNGLGWRGKRGEDIGG